MNLLESAAAAVARTSLEASLLVALVLLAQKLFRSRLSPSWRHALWLLVLGRLLLPTSFQTSWSLFNLPRWHRAVPAESHALPLPMTPINLAAAPLESGENVKSVKEVESGELSNSTELKPTAPSPLLTIETNAAFRSLPDSIPAPGSATQTQFSIQPLPASASLWEGVGMRAKQHKNTVLAWTAFFWLSIAALLMARLVVAHFRFLRNLRNVPPTRSGLLFEIFHECARATGLKTQVTLFETPMVETPALFGLLRPKLLFPPNFGDRFLPAEIRHVVLHELAHLHRRDLWLNWLIHLLQAVHWFNPVIWFAFSRMKLDRELACDAWALSLGGANEREHYGQTVIKLLESIDRPMKFSGAVGILESQSQIKERIRSIARFEKKPRSSALALALVAGLGLLTLTDAQTEKQPDAASANKTNPLESKPADAPNSENPLGKGAPGTLVKEGRTLLEMGEVDEAEKKLKQAIHKDPNNKAAAYWLRLLSDIRLAKASRQAEIEHYNQPRFEYPDATVKNPHIIVSTDRHVPFGAEPAISKDPAQRKEQIAELIQDGRLLMEMGLLDRAEMKLVKAEREDPGNQAAAYYLKLIMEQRVQLKALGHAGLAYDLPSDPDKLAWSYVPLPNAKGKPASGNPEVVRTLEGQRLQAENNYITWNTLLQRLLDLRKKSPERLREALPTALPDEGLSKLLTDLMSAEQNDVMASKELGPAHPIVLKGRAVIEKINQQIETRIEGMLQGLTARVDLMKETMLFIDQKIAESKKPGAKTMSNNSSTDRQLDPADGPEMVRILEGQRLQAENNYITWNTLLQRLLDLRKKSPERLREALPTVLPDDGLSKLLTDLMNAEQNQVMQLREIGPEHPVAVKGRAVLDRINKQIETRIDGILEGLSARVDQQKETIRLFDQRFAEARRRDAETLNHFSVSRRRIFQKLNSIILDEVLFDNIPLAEVVRDLTKESRKRDPEGQGINFIVFNNADPQPSAAPAGGVDAFGNSLPATVAAPTVPVGNVLVKISPALRNVTLAQVLDAITKAADLPLMFSVEDYGVVFSARKAEPPILYTRTFKVDPATFMQSLQSAMRGLPRNPPHANQPALGLDPLAIQPDPRAPAVDGVTAETNRMDNEVALLRDFFTAHGVDCSTNSFAVDAHGNIVPTGKAIFYKDRMGVIFVRATLDDLDRIEKLIQVLNTAPPQISLVAQMFEVKLDPQQFAGTETPRSNQTSGTNQTPAAIGTITGIITDSQFAALKQTLEELFNTHELTRSSPASQVTTLDGRKAALQFGDGSKFEITPTVRPDGISISLDVNFSRPARGNGETPFSLTSSAIVGDRRSVAISSTPTGAPGSPETAKRIVLMITPTIIDPAGNPIHPNAGIAAAGPPLTKDQATILARDLANKKAKELFQAEPFSNKSPARLIDGQWQWRERVGHGPADLEATVQFLPDGAEPKVQVLLLHSGADRF